MITDYIWGILIPLCPSLGKPGCLVWKKGVINVIQKCLCQSSVFLYLNWKYHYELMRFYVCVHMYESPHPTPRLESLKWTETVTDSVAMNIPSDQTRLINYFSLKKPQDFLEKLLTPSLVQEINKMNLYNNCLT